MKMIITTLMGLTLSMAATASPRQLITHNLTDYESNAYVSGTIPSPYPTKAHSTGKVYWAGIKMSCFGHTLQNKCVALVRAETDTAHPVDVGFVELNIETGEITPQRVHGNGYTLTVNGIAECTLSKD